MSALGGLIGEIELDEFFLKYWEKKYVRSSAAVNPGRSAYFAGLFSLNDLDGLLSTSGPRFKDFYRLSVGGDILSRDDYSIDRQDGLVDFMPDRITKLYADGATITVNRAHQCSSTLGQLCAAISHELRAHANANVYVTPPYAQGFSAHADTHDVFLLQVSGTKSWKIQPHLEYLANRRYPNTTSDPSKSETWEETVLLPGDVMYIPRGLLHKGVTDQSSSIHATIGIHGYLWADLVRDIVAELEATHSNFRRSANLADSEVNECLATIAAALASRLSDLGAVGALVDLRTRALVKDCQGKFLSASRLAEVTESVRFRVRGGIDASLELAENSVVLRHGDRSLWFPDYIERHLRLILTSTLCARDLPSDLDMEGRLTLLRRLYAERVIEIVSPLEATLSEGAERSFAKA